jgi:GT2 family glycosyltransferase
MIGPADQGLPLYYEDIEWCYRAKVYGYNVRAAPKAVIYHAFGRRIHTGEEADLTPQKLRNVVYGRLRFAARILSWFTFLRFLFGYWVADGIRMFSVYLDWIGYHHVQFWLEVGFWRDFWESYGAPCHPGT